jgi:hypothetical protein
VRSGHSEAVDHEGSYAIVTLGASPSAPREREPRRAKTRDSQHERRSRPVEDVRLASLHKRNRPGRAVLLEPRGETLLRDGGSGAAVFRDGGGGELVAVERLAGQGGGGLAGGGEPVDDDRQRALPELGGDLAGHVGDR